MKSKRHYLFQLLLLILICGLASISLAGVDAPHNYGAMCQNCHDAAKLNATSGGVIDNTPINVMCKSCHSAGQGAMPQETHSARSTASEYWGGAWVNDCSVCHNPHYQRQSRLYTGNYPLGPSLIRGTIQAGGLGIVGNTLTATAPIAPTDTLKGQTLAPNMLFPIYYRIASNDGNTITTTTDMEPGLEWGVTTFSTFYGKLIREKIDSGRTITNTSGDILYADSRRDVRLFNGIGPMSLVPPGDETNAATVAICVVCHTRAKRNNYGMAVYKDGFEDDAILNMAGYTGHTDSDDETCWDNTSNCHSTPAQGFAQNAATCGTCHGTDMKKAGDLVKMIKNGTNKTVYTLSPSIYNHPKHVTRYGTADSCGYCHYQGMVPSKADLANDPNVGDYKTLMQFWVNTPYGYMYNEGTYYGFKNQTELGILNDIFDYEGYSFGIRNDSTACENTYCHGNTLADGSSKRPQWKVGTVACGDCHNATNATPPTSGSHSKHVKTGAGESQVFAPRTCNTCHPHDGAMSSSGVHVDGSANILMVGNIVLSGGQYVNSSAPAVGPVPRALANFGNCDNLPCHGTGSSPRWGYSISANCDACHNKAGDMGGSWSAAHETHVTDYLNIITCNACHSAVAPNNTQINPANKSFHVDGYKTVEINTTNYGASAEWIGGNCSSVTCHSTGDRLGGEGYGYKAQAWSGSLTCSGCHKYNATSATMYSEADGVSNMTDVHVKHVATDERNYKCSMCHQATTSDGTSITTKANHTDGNKQMQYDTLASGTSFNNVNYNCTTSYCHSTGESSPTYPGTNANWNNKSTGACGTCHGVNDVTPPASNMHDTHVATADGYYFACSKCHNGIVSATTNSTSVPAVSDQTLHVDGIRNVVFDSAHAGASASWNGSNCSSTYCHSTGKEALAVANLPAAYSGSVYTTVSWSSGTTDCNSCHGKSRGDGRPDYATGGAGKYDANTHLDGSHVSACYECHLTTVDNANTITTEHVDGSIDVIFNDGGSYGAGKSCTVVCHTKTHSGTQKWGTTADCFACHGQPPHTNADIIKADADPSGRTSDFSNAAGLHDYHYNTTSLGFDNCAFCHLGADGSSNHNPAGAKTVHIGFGTSGVYVGGTYLYKAFANTNYSAASSDVSTSVTQTGATRTCTNIYCHSDGGAYTGGKTYASPNWDVGGDGTPTYECDICHGNGAGAYATTDRHTVHATTYGYKCYECHTETVDINNNIIGNHVNGTKQVNLSAGGSYARPVCSSTYCHSPGNKSSAYDSPEYTAMWNDSALNCDECHAGNAGAVLNTISTYAHGTHIDNATAVGRNIGCAECHAATASSDTVVSSAANHVNKKVNIQFDNNINKDSYSPTYNGVDTTGSNGSLRNPGDGTANCNNVYCHSSGNLDSGGTRLTYKNVSWAVSDLDCDDCHGDANGKSHSTFPNEGMGLYNANSHDKHVDGASAYACQKCHYWTGGLSNNPTSVFAGLAHINGVEDVVFQEFGGRTGTYLADKTCDNTYCHGTSNPRWGDPAARLCNSCHDATNSGDLSLRHDVHYNSPTAATSLGTTNSPTATAYVFGCGNCHPATHTEGPATTGEQDAEIDGPMIDYLDYSPDTITNDVDGKGYNYTVAGQCDNSYCHSDGKGGSYASPKWNDPKTGGSCDICHRDKSGGAASWSSRHNAHMLGNYASNTNIGCNACHAGTASSDSQIAGLYGMTNHVDGDKDIVFNGWSGGTGTGPDCSGTYCHSDGNGIPGGSINWTSTPNTSCGACHDFGGASTTLSAAHDAHTDAGTYSFACDKCHKQVVTGVDVINTYSMHVNKVKDVDADHGFSGGNCSSSDCHSTGYRPGETPNRDYVNQAWTGGTLGCTGCHRMADTAANMSGEAIPMSAAHIAHVANAQGEYGNENDGDSARGAQAIKCGNCHNGTTADGVSIRADGIANHVNGGLANVVFNVSDWSDPNIPAGTPSYNPTTKTCSNIYCHSYGSVKRDDVVFNTATWTATLDCSGCHANPPPEVSDHSGVSSGCTSCHGHVNATDDGFKSTADGISLHINNAIEGGGCTGCHGQPPINDGNIIQADKNPSGRSTDFANAAGLHDYHYNTTMLGFDSCAYCHKGAELGQGANHNSDPKKVHIGFGSSGVYLGGTYLYKAFYNTSYSATFSDGSTTVTQTGATRTCTNIYCHSDGGAYTGGKTYASPNWDVGGDGTPTYECDICHGNGAGAYATTDRHTVHATTYGYKCYECHTETVDINNNIIGNHVNGTKQVNLSAGGSYARPVCSSTYCHSPGNKSSAYDSPEYTAMWNDSALNCDECHAGNAGAVLNTISTNTHLTHIDNTTAVGRNIGCAECHAATASSDTVVSSAANHVNKKVNIKFNSAYDGYSPTYNGVVATGNGSLRNPGDGTANCNNVYCHSTGNLGTGATITFKNISWAVSDVGCNGCHGDAGGKVHSTFPNGGIGHVDANSHDKHVDGASAYACQKCHYWTGGVSNRPTAVFASLSHINGVEDVAFQEFGGKTGSYLGDKTCDNTYCHGTSNPRWGDPSTIACDGCHGASNTSGLSLRHDVHYNSPAAATSLGATNSPTASAYVFGCGNCHPDNLHTEGPVTTGEQDANIDGAMIAFGDYSPDTVSNDVDGKGYNYTVAGQCDNSYCHSDGKGGSYASPKWNDPKTGGSCDICHRDKSGGAASWSSRHNAHMIGNYATNTNIGCNACHAGTASSDSQIAGLYGMTNHVDGDKDVVFNGWSGGTGTGSDCSGTYCHSDGNGTAGGNINWTSTPNTVCTDCHDGAGQSTTLSAAHAEHTNSTNNFACDKCHNQVVNGSGVINDYSMHVNQAKDVDAALGSGGSCNANQCHGDSTKDTWTTDRSSYDHCTICHGELTTGANGSTISSAPYKVAPGGAGSDTNGDTGDGDAQVGAHQAHLTTPLNYGANVLCSDCHIVPATANAEHHIDNSLPAEVYFSDFVKNEGTLSPGYTYGGGSCTNTYCHGNNMPGGSTDGLNKTPDWNTNSYLVGASNFNSDCSRCHGFPPKGYSTTHTDYTTNDGSSCGGCHAEIYACATGDDTEQAWVANGTAFKWPDWHINGIVNAPSGCTGCHGYPPETGDGVNVGGANDGGKGAHDTVNNSHVNTVVLDAENDEYGVSSPGWDECAKCHQNDTHKNAAIVIDIESEYSFDGLTNAVYLGEWGNPDKPKNCFNVLCHFTKTPRWSAGNDE